VAGQLVSGTAAVLQLCQHSLRRRQLLLQL
jgi:hypothetical protein